MKSLKITKKSIAIVLFILLFVFAAFLLFFPKEKITAEASASSCKLTGGKYNAIMYTKLMNSYLPLPYSGTVGDGGNMDPARAFNIYIHNGTWSSSSGYNNPAFSYRNLVINLMGDGSGDGKWGGLFKPAESAIKLYKDGSTLVGSVSLPMITAFDFFNGTLSDGNYKVVIELKGMALGNQYMDGYAEYSFVVDTVAPNVSLSNVDSNGFSKSSSVSATFSTSNGGAGSGGKSHSEDYINAYYGVSSGTGFPSESSCVNAFSSGRAFTEEGNYRVRLVDRAGNVTTKTFTIDRTSPTFTNAPSNKSFLKDSTTVTFSNSITGKGGQRTSSSDTITAKYSSSTGKDYPTSSSTSFSSNTTFSNAGHYRLQIGDTAGNTTVLYFTIDKSAPDFELSNATGTVDSGGFSNTDIKVSWATTYTGITDNLSMSTDKLTVTYARNTSSSFPTEGQCTLSVSNNTTFSAEGNYRVKIVDSAGNVTSKTFTIDKSTPKFNNSTSYEFTNISYLVSWSNTVGNVGSNRVNSNDTLKAMYARDNTMFPAISSCNISLSNNTTFNQAGYYTFIISDSSKNTSSFNLVIDKTAPALSISNLNNNSFSAESIIATTNNEIFNSITTTGRTCTKDSITLYYARSTGVSFPSESSSYTQISHNTMLTQEGNYRVKAVDASGNTTSKTFTIDKTQPTGTLKTDDGSAFVQMQTKANVTFQYSNVVSGVGSNRTNDNDILTVMYGFSPTYQHLTPDTPYTGQTFTEEGRYTILLTDSSNNPYSTYFEIYRKKPTYKIINTGLKELDISNPFYNQDIRILKTRSTDTVTINGKDYDDTYISDEGSYSLKIVDLLGNTTTETITIIKTPPLENKNRLKSPLNKWYETTDSNNKMYSFASYENAYNMADNRERATIQYGVWTSNTWDGGAQIAPSDLNIAIPGLGQSYYIYRAYDNSNINYAYFSLESLNNAIEIYIQASLKTLYIPNIPSTAAVGENVYRDIYFTKEAITFRTIQNCQLYINGVLQNYPYVLSQAGTHTITETDFAGNSVNYIVIIDIVTPIVRVTNLNGNLPSALNYGITHYFTYGLIVSLDDIDEQSILTINGESYIGGSVELRQAGIFSVSTRDAAGNTGSLIIYISLIEPTITIVQNEVNEIINSFSVFIDKNYKENTITSLSIFKLIDGDWKIPDGLSASPSTLEYHFDKSGDYKIIVVDIFGRWIEKEYSFIKGAPKGILYVSSGVELASGSASRLSVYFTWSSNLNCSAVITGGSYQEAPYTRAQLISAEGSYTIKLYSNVEDIYNLYIFVIDKTPPAATLIADGKELSDGGTTRFPVICSWVESGCTATLNGLPYANGSTIAEEGEHFIVITDSAGNRTTINFRIKTTPPILSVTTTNGKINNYDITRYDAYLSWTEKNCVALVNGALYEKNTRIYLEGSYTVILTDAYGNVTSFFFTIDKTAPTGDLISEGKVVQSGFSTNKGVSFVWDESDCTATLNDTYVYEKGTIITIDGSYSLRLSDPAGNYIIVTFNIKTTPPVGKILVNSNEVESGTRTRYDARFTWTELGATCTVNGSSYTKNSYVYLQGSYEFVLTDAYGNTAIYTITIDKIPPIITATSNGDILSNNNITKHDVFALWDKNNCTATLNGVPYEQGAFISNAAEHTLIVTDDVGNSSKIVFIIDRTPKDGTLISNSQILESGGITKYSVYFTWSALKCTAYVNGEPYSRASLISDEGFYLVELYDSAGNGSSYSFTIDKTAPEAYGFAVKNDTPTQIENYYIGNEDIYFTWEEENCIATLNGNPYIKGEKITEEKEHIFILTDSAGNSYSLTFTIDKSAPVIKAFTSQNNPLADNDMVAQSIYINWSKSSCTATVNGEAYDKNTLITESGTYVFIVQDAYGNISTITIIIDKTVPEAVVLDINEEYFVLPYTQKGFYIEWDNSDYVAKLNGEDYIKGTKITDEGTYTFILTNLVGTQTIIEIVIDRSAPEVSIITQTGGTVENNGHSYDFFYFTWDKEGCTALLNDNPYKKGEYLYTDGTYTLIITDSANNSATYIAYLHREKPTVAIYSVESEDIIDNGSQVNGAVKIVPLSADNLKIQVSHLNNEYEYELDKELSEYGKYVVIVTDAYGITNKYEFTIKEPRLTDDNGGIFGGVSGGSSTGTVLFTITIVGLLVAFIGIPALNTFVLKKDRLKGRLKKQK